MKLTVEKFLKDGHLFQDWDCLEDEIGRRWFVGQVNSDGIAINLEDANSPWVGDDKRFVIKARCLMLPKHFRLYEDMDDNGDVFFIVNKSNGRFDLVNKSEIASAARDFKGELLSDNLQWYNVKPIISFAQLEN